MFTSTKKGNGRGRLCRVNFGVTELIMLVFCFGINLNPVSLQALPDVLSNNYSEVFGAPLKNQNLVETVLIEDDASPRDLGELLIAFRKAGIKVDNKINRKRRYNWIKDIHFHFQHPKGLNFKVKVTGFQKLSFQFVYDAQKEFKYFTFRINDEAVYNLVEMDIKGYKNYVCYDTGLVVMGETNEDIIRFY